MGKDRNSSFRCGVRALQLDFSEQPRTSTGITICK
jgi:hypothetical protein